MSERIEYERLGTLDLSAGIDRRVTERTDEAERDVAEARGRQASEGRAAAVEESPDASLGSDPTLAEIVRRLVATYQPERIYLFGSMARGDAGPDSDYDLMVVVPDDAALEQQDSRRAYEILWGIERGADVIVWTKSRFERRSRVVASLPAAVLREGRLVHAA